MDWVKYPREYTYSPSDRIVPPYDEDPKDTSPAGVQMATMLTQPVIPRTKKLPKSVARNARPWKPRAPTPMPLPAFAAIADLKTVWPFRIGQNMNPFTIVLCLALIGGTVYALYNTAALKTILKRR